MRSSKFKRGAGLLALLLALGWSRPARADLAGESVILSAILSTELAQAADIAMTVKQITDFVKATNEVLALTRQAVKVYNTILNYTPQRLLMDARRGLYQAIPEARQLEVEVRAGIENGRAIKGGPEAFLGHRDHHDPWAQQMNQALFSLGYRGLAGEVMKGVGGLYSEGPTTAERLLAAKARDAGELVKNLKRRSALGVMAKKTEFLIKDAEEKGRTDLAAQSLALRLQIEAAANTGDIASLQKLIAAEHEAQRNFEAAFNKGFSASLRMGSARLFRPFSPHRIGRSLEQPGSVFESAPATSSGPRLMEERQ